MSSLQTLTLGFSPCPNDTFIFDAMVNGKIKTELNYEVVLADVEALNQKAFREELDITKLSFYAWLQLQDKYDLLESGSALGNGCGPLLIAKSEIDLHSKSNLKIAIPGKNTTANFLFCSCFPHLKNQTVEVLFSKIEEAVLNNEVDAGVIIHENRFTYADKGLVKLIDLGEWWETETGSAIPLGGIAIKKSLGAELKVQVETNIRESAEFAFANLPFLPEYVKENSQEMNEEVMRKHIDLYVNDYTKDLGEEGWKAINTMKAYWKKFKS